MSSTVSDFKHRLFKYIITIKQMKSNFIEHFLILYYCKGLHTQKIKEPMLFS